LTCPATGWPQSEGRCGRIPCLRAKNYSEAKATKIVRKTNGMKGLLDIWDLYDHKQRSLDKIISKADFATIN